MDIPLYLETVTYAITIFGVPVVIYIYSICSERKEQWQGWNIEIQEWPVRDDFRKTWDEQYCHDGKNFADYFNAICHRQTGLKRAK